MTPDGEHTDRPAVTTTTRAAAKAARRLLLIDATMTSIAQYGLSGTTLARVTDLAGTSIGLANFHFDSKERLFEATLQFLADEQRDLWQNRSLDATLSAADRLLAIVDSRFHPSICDVRKLAVWFAFWGDAGAREIYRRVVADDDDERLDATVILIAALASLSGQSVTRPIETALGMEAFYDGLWLNMLLYPDDFPRMACRQKALDYIAALFPAQFASRPDRA